MINEIQIKERWKNKDDLISQILENLRKGNFFEQDLRGINLSHKDLSGINFKNINLSYADLSNSNLNGANFKNADFSFANLNSCNLENADFSTTILTGANFEKVKVSDNTDWGLYFAYFLDKRKENKSGIGYLIYLFMKYIFRYSGYKGKIYTEKIAKTKEEYRASKLIYRALRVSYKSFEPGISHYFYYREKHCDLKIYYPWWHPVKWIGMLWEKISCSGTAPLRFFLSVVIFIFLCAFPYYLFENGIIRNLNNGETHPIITFNDAIYFSFVTFTSLGYGDFSPNLDSKSGRFLTFFCCFEVLIGIISIGVIAAIIFQFMSID